MPDMPVQPLAASTGCPPVRAADATLYHPRHALPVFISAFSITNLPEDRIFQQGDLGVTGMPHPECPSSSEFIISARFLHHPIIKYHDGKHAEDRGIFADFSDPYHLDFTHDSQQTFFQIFPLTPDLEIRPWVFLSLPPLFSGDQFSF